jgi:D-sedoheptulose 7-phosphate isomerase
MRYMEDNDNLMEIVSDHLTASAELKLKLTTEDKNIIINIVNLIVDAYKKGGKVILFGNGGSAADAQHIAGEFTCKFYLERKALPAIALTTNSSSVTAIANDYDYNRIFARQVEAFVNAEDVVIGISTSGTSPNVLEGIETAKKIGAKTIGLAGQKGTRIGELADITFNVPSKETPRIQEVHITVGHIICFLVERELFGQNE